MRQSLWPARKKERRAAVLAGLILLQALCALFFIGDVIKDLGTEGLLTNPYLSLEAAAAVALISGVIFLMIELRGLLMRMSDMQTGLEIAHGNLAAVIDGFFDDWNLTDAERDVAIMILKGLDNDTIAQVRNTAPGTVRAQSARLYAKSATDGRAQFISLFVEELMAGGVSSEIITEPATSNPSQEGLPAKDRLDV